MKIKPPADRILVKRVEPDETTRGGIVIPDTAKEDQQEAEVMTVGSGRMDDSGKRVPVDVKRVIECFSESLQERKSKLRMRTI